MTILMSRLIPVNLLISGRKLMFQSERKVFTLGFEPFTIRKLVKINEKNQENEIHMSR